MPDQLIDDLARIAQDAIDQVPDEEQRQLLAGRLRSALLMEDPAIGRLPRSSPEQMADYLERLRPPEPGS